MPSITSARRQGQRPEAVGSADGVLNADCGMEMADDELFGTFRPRFVSVNGNDVIVFPLPGYGDAEAALKSLSKCLS